MSKSGEEEKKKKADYPATRKKSRPCLATWYLWPPITHHHHHHHHHEPQDVRLIAKACALARKCAGLLHAGGLRCRGLLRRLPRQEQGRFPQRYQDPERCVAISCPSSQSFTILRCSPLQLFLSLSTGLHQVSLGRKRAPRTNSRPNTTSSTMMIR